MRERYPMAREILNRWTGKIRETHDNLALIGRAPGEDNVYVASRGSGMRLTHGTLAGLIITDLIDGAEVPWAKLYDPRRAAPRSGAVTRRGAQDEVSDNASPQGDAASNPFGRHPASVTRQSPPAA